MSKPDQAREPSMSDILASIRKIISDEPAGAPQVATAPAVPPAPREMTARAAPAPEPILPSAPAAPAAVSVDDLLAMSGDAAPPPRITPEAKTAVTDQSARPVEPAAPSWLFPRAKTPSVEPAAPAMPPPALRAEPAPRAFSEPASMRAEPLMPPPAPSLSPAPAATAAPQNEPTGLQGDLGKLVPTRMEAPGLPRLDPPLPSAPADSAALRAPAQPPPSMPPSETAPSAPASIQPTGSTSEPAPIRTPLIDRLTASARNLIGEPKAAAPASAADPSEATTEIVQPPRAVDPAPVVAKQPEPARPAPAPARPALAETPLPPKAAASSPLPIMPALVPGPARSAPTAAPPNAPAAVKAPEPSPTATPSPAGRSMEEVVVELLRPMIRDWLDANLPRLLEPALKAELAEREKAKGASTSA